MLPSNYPGGERSQSDLVCCWNTGKLSTVSPNPMSKVNFWIPLSPKDLPPNQWLFHFMLWDLLLGIISDDIKCICISWCLPLQQASWALSRVLFCVWVYEIPLEDQFLNWNLSLAADSLLLEILPGCRCPPAVRRGPGEIRTFISHSLGECLFSLNYCVWASRLRSIHISTGNFFPVCGRIKFFH